ncbi:MAG: hypothetical protein Q8O22_02380 [Candidatus Omnitrophota bacterium]|nr:hypothetical protein [Candidatus Omnitrophota bacterium]
MSMDRFIEEKSSTFLTEIDEYLKLNYKNISCDELCQTYIMFCESLRKKIGTNDHFSGFSEALLYRFIFHKIETERNINFYQSDESKKGLFKADKINLEIGQNQKIKLPKVGKRNFCEPDISFCSNGVLTGAIEVKTYPAFGRATIIEVFDDYKKTRIQFNNFKALLIMYYSPPSKRGKSVITEQLEQCRDDSSGCFDYICLKGEEKKLDEICNIFFKKIGIFGE